MDSERLQAGGPGGAAGAESPGAGFAHFPGRVSLDGRTRAMAGAVAESGRELPAFAGSRDPSAPRLAYGYGYGPGSLRELRAREFGRLAGEAGEGAGVGTRGFWNRRGRLFCC